MNKSITEEKMEKRRKLSVKLMWIFVGIVVAILAAFNTVSWIARAIDVRIWAHSVYISGIVLIVLILVSFVLIMNKWVVRRIENLNKAVSEIAKGNFDLSVPTAGNDELTELSENFNKMTAELQANAFLSKDFTRNVSHEFKTPISVIRSYAEAAQSSDDKSALEEYMKIIIEESDRLANLSKNVLELSRMGSTTIIPKEDRFLPAEQIRSVILASQLQWSEKNITVEPELEEFEITSNESLLFRVWQNLIGNAIKFTDDNGTIKIDLKKQKSELLFVIEDNGIGIADEDKEKIFNPFFTGDKSHNKEGSGLGLPLVKSIVEKLGGRISFESERGKGTTFTVRLPL